LRSKARVRRQNQTKAESVLWRELRAHRLHGLSFRRQVPLGRFIADFVCHKAKLIVELDGDAHRDREKRDRERDTQFQHRGYCTLRFCNEDVLSYPERVLEEIRRVCADRLSPEGLSPALLAREEGGDMDGAQRLSPLPDPPPQGGREGVGALHPRHASQVPHIRTTHAVRLGFRQIKGFREDDALRLVQARGEPYRSVRDLWLRSGISRAGLERLAEADAFRSIGLDRRAALWEVRALDPLSAAERLPLFAAASDTDLIREPEIALPDMKLGEHVVNDYRSLSLSLKAHPVSFLRTELDAAGIVAAGRLLELKSGRRISVAGLVLVRQRPGTASGVIFATLEDETGVANIIVWPKVFERFRPIVLGARLLKVTGRLQSEQNVIHVVAARLEDYSPLLSKLSLHSLGLNGMAPTDEVRRPVDELRHFRKPNSPLARMLASDPELAEELRAAKDAASVMPKGRNFQ
jgi:error-prone DNA polymerase